METRRSFDSSERSSTRGRGALDLRRRTARSLWPCGTCSTTGAAARRFCRSANVAGDFWGDRSNLSPRLREVHAFWVPHLGADVHPAVDLSENSAAGSHVGFPCRDPDSGPAADFHGHACAARPCLAGFRRRLSACGGRHLARPDTLDEWAIFRGVALLDAHARGGPAGLRKLLFLV